MSTQMLRLPQVSLPTILATPAPSIDLRLTSYYVSTSNFLKAVSSYKHRALTSLTALSSKHAAESKRLSEKAHALETETNQCKVREIELVGALEREKEERKDAELEVAALKRQLAALREKSAAIESDIEQYKAITDNLRRERASERSTLLKHASSISPEVSALEAALGCSLEGIENGHLLLRFFHLSRASPELECSLVFDVSQGYKVVTASPPLPTLALLVNTLVETNRFNEFVRDVRQAYLTHLNPNS
ncbi:hypothetical protein H0H87_011831 [Tephrocybe sp. NHM501043]|nr:hypothetical protein H0H87_011831 [Tephrocybe sp. NHM501043]